MINLFPGLVCLGVVKIFHIFFFPCCTNPWNIKKYIYKTFVVKKNNKGNYLNRPKTVVLIDKKEKISLKGADFKKTKQNTMHIIA